MRPTLLIKTNEAWANLKTVSPAICVLSQLSDISAERPIVQAHTVVFDNCDKNFVYYRLNDRTFPCMTTLILHSHPCDPKIVQWMAKQHHMRILVHENRYYYINRWCPNVKVEAAHIRPISEVHYHNLLANFLDHQDSPRTKD